MAIGVVPCARCGRMPSFVQSLPGAGHFVAIQCCDRVVSHQLPWPTKPDDYITAGQALRVAWNGPNQHFAQA